jgi:hypothetical protein
LNIRDFPGSFLEFANYSLLITSTAIGKPGAIAYCLLPIATYVCSLILSYEDQIFSGKAICQLYIERHSQRDGNSGGGPGIDPQGIA